MKTDMISPSLKMFLILLSLFLVTFQAQGQDKGEKQSPLKGLGSKLKEKAVPAGLGGKSSKEKENPPQGKKSENNEEEYTGGELDPDEEKFDEDEDDPDKMMEKMIRQFGQDPEDVKRKMSEEGADADPKAIPNPDENTIASIKATPRNEAELFNFLKDFENGADQALSPEAQKDVAPHLNKGLQTKEAGYMLWLSGKQEPAAYLMLKASIADPQDELLLSNLASVITMAGYAENSIPILEYLHQKNPQSSIVNNNLGQAWLSLGQITKAKPFLEQAVSEYEQHPEANRSLARIAMKENNTALAKSYLKNALKGGFSQDAYFELRDLEPSGKEDRMEILKLDHKRNYREVAVTKRFTMPVMPESNERALSREQEIADFFHGLSLTTSALYTKYPSGTDKLFDSYQKITAQMVVNNWNMKSLEDVQKQYSLAAQVWNPFKIQAQEVLMTELDDSYASSFNKRIAKLQEARDSQIKAQEESFAADIQKMGEISKRIAVLEDGDGSGAEIDALIKQLCEMRKNLDKTRIEKTAPINNAFVQQMESLAFQRLQEYTYWYTLYFLPQDPTEFAYALYGEYLSTLSQLQKYYPYPVIIYSEEGCESQVSESVNPKGKMSVWEDTHCITHWDLDFYFVKSKFTCKEATIEGKLYDIEFGGGQKYDPSTLETVEHSVYIGGKIGDIPIAVGKALESKLGLGAVYTMKFDGNWNLKDIIVKASIGAELGMSVPKSSDPNDSGLDIRDLTSIGVSKEYEFSLLTGFRGNSPKISTVGDIFSKQ
ncbi:hypothetical protein EF405_03750 [Cyclobacteriaceae bacterium YHN15]|nr:hypothetical protein EF405_03750 [Cyclobacteriaceae bacterium YHN15]